MGSKPLKTAVVVTAEFEAIWPYVADHLRQELGGDSAVQTVRVPAGQDTPLPELITAPAQVERLIALGIDLGETELDALPALVEVVASLGYQEPPGLAPAAAARGIRLVTHESEGFWGQSVAEFALGLTIAALRRIPQRHHQLIAGPDPWQYPAEQYADDPRFSSGTVQGKRVRIVGAGNVASRYAAFTHALGADVAAWDPYAAEPAFDRAGSRREHFLDRLIEDAEIFAPMVPLTDGTRGLVDADLLRRLPSGCLVVLATRAAVVDVAELRRRVTADELSLAADVFDVEPLPPHDPLIGRDNVVHTPHLAGRTKEANLRWATMLLDRFSDDR